MTGLCIRSLRRAAVWPHRHPFICALKRSAILEYQLREFRTPAVSHCSTAVLYQDARSWPTVRRGPRFGQGHRRHPQVE